MLHTYHNSGSSADYHRHYHSENILPGTIITTKSNSISLDAIAFEIQQMKQKILMEAVLSSSSSKSSRSSSSSNNNNFKRRFEGTTKDEKEPIYNNNKRRKLSQDSKRQDSGTTATEASGGSVVVVTLRPNDVICGRTSFAFNHYGNRNFRVIIGTYLQDYRNAVTRQERSAVIQHVMDVLQYDVGARFLKVVEVNKAKQTKKKNNKSTAKTTKTNVPKRRKGHHQHHSECNYYYVELDDVKMREKIGHALRDLAVVSTKKIEPQHPTGQGQDHDDDDDEEEEEEDDRPIVVSPSTVVSSSSSSSSFDFSDHEEEKAPAGQTNDEELLNDMKNESNQEVRRLSRCSFSEDMYKCFLSLCSNVDEEEEDFFGEESHGDIFDPIPIVF